MHAVGIDATDRGDLGPRDRLLVGDDRQGLERGAREPGALVVQQEALDVRRQVGRGLIAPAAGDLDQFEPVAGRDVRLGELLAPLFDQDGRLFEQLSEELGGNGVVGNQHDRLDRALVLRDPMVDRFAGAVAAESSMLLNSSDTALSPRRRR